jgi:NodT family efflux transporter outer membrane factor (OMF) lipoprotein
VLLVSALLCVAGCAPRLGPAPRLADATRFASKESFAGPEAEWPKDAWWTAYGDPQLNSLIEAALKDGPDLRAAEARLTEALGRREEAGAAERPQFDAKTSVTEARIGQSIGLPPTVSGFLPSGYHILTQSSANLSYALDFFGRNRAALAEATSIADAARADRAAARLELAVAVARAYADFLRLSADRAAAADAVRVRTDTLRLVGERRRNGLETRGEYSQQNAAVADARTDVDAFDLQILRARHEIAALLGRGPDRGLELLAAPASKTLRPPGVPAEIGLELVGRRPDLVAARLRAEAARRGVAVARADFYPNVNLAASGLAFSLNDQNPFARNIALTQFGPAVSLPIFTGGRLEGALRDARGRYDEAVAIYDRTLARALQDVADALSSQRAAAVQLRDAEAAQAAADDAYAIAKLRYQGGLAPYLNVLAAEGSVLREREAVADLSVQAFSYDLALVRALGGGYRAGPDAPARRPAR